MIYTYKYLPHRIENFHKKLCYFFEQLFQHDPGVYDERLLWEPDFIVIISSSTKIKGYLKDITEKYHLLEDQDKLLVKKAYEINNKIDILCADVNCDEPVKYDEIKNKEFRELLKEFFGFLWDKYPYNVKSIKNSFGQVRDHFNDFVHPNHQEAYICPFCGLYSLKPSGGKWRNAYDHYLPQKFYPFIAVNFKNLFPMCHDCNSDEKKATDTPYKGAVRRKVLYPCDRSYETDKLSVVIEPKAAYNPTNLKTLLTDIDWEYAITLAGILDPRLASWDEIFQIKRRYREHIVIYQGVWFNDFLMKRYREDMEDGLSFSRYKEKILKGAKEQIYHSPLSILRFVYFNFIFSITDIEGKMKESIKI